MTRRPAFWIAFLLVALASVVFAQRYFTRAFPFLSLEIAMDREMALAAARELAAANRLGPPEYRQAASFSVDREAQTFIELEGGGKDAFRRVLQENLHAAYHWRVRHFREGETREVTFSFRPDGRPYGFRERLPEDEPGTSLEPGVARAIARDTATDRWGVDLDVYEPIEQAQEVRPGGRIDHTFVYERPDERLGEGRYRLRLVVSGDRLTEVAYFVRVPEGFSRRHEEMRSANMALGIGSSVAMTLFYIIGGVGVGLFFLLRWRWLLWKPAVRWGVAIALLQALAMLNQWPLLWMDYDTALSREGFIAQQIAMVVAVFVGFSLLLGASFLAAEGLTRRAFPDHPQLWRVWRRDAAATPAVLGRTVAGYLLIAVFFAYEVGLYFFSTRMLDWWTPSDLLFHPDVLATYVPWFTAIAVSLQAGFWEESLFRAVPLAGAALIGARFGRRGLFIGIAMVAQAVIFGAGHAPYPTQPAYARLVELVLPSFAFGLIYLRFGLLPAILLHFGFDVVWFALPLFASTAPGSWLNQAMVVAVALAPAWIVLWSRWRLGAWRELDARARNGAWMPPPRPVPVPTEPVPVLETAGPSPRALRVILACGVAGLAIWVGTRAGGTEIPPLAISRPEAARLAHATLADRGLELPDGWKVLPSARSGHGMPHRFVWETAGRDRYFDLLGRSLPVPHWHVRVVTFEGDVAERAESWEVLLTGRGSVEGIRHGLPEARAGASLDEEEARRLALAFLRSRFGIDPADLTPVAATPSALPARVDWRLTFGDGSTPPLPQGEPRLEVTIAGDEVTDARRFVHVPEEWQRQQRRRETLWMVQSVAVGLSIALILLAGGAAALAGWSRGAFAIRLFAGMLALLLGVGAAQFVNQLPSAMAGFSTAQPFGLQLVMMLGIALMAIMVTSLLAALAAGAAPRWLTSARELPRRSALAVGLAAGAIAAGFDAIMEVARRAEGPLWPSVGQAGAVLPAVATALDPVTGLIMRTVVLLLIFIGADRFTGGWTRRRPAAAAGLILLGAILGGAPAQQFGLWVASALVAGLVMLALYVAVFRFDLAVLPVAAGTAAALSLLGHGLHQAYPGALPGAALGTLLIAVVSWRWFEALRRTRAMAPSPAQEHAAL